MSFLCCSQMTDDTTLVIVKMRNNGSLYYIANKKNMRLTFVYKNRKDEAAENIDWIRMCSIVSLNGAMESLTVQAVITRDLPLLLQQYTDADSFENKVTQKAIHKTAVACL